MTIVNHDAVKAEASGGAGSGRAFEGGPPIAIEAHGDAADRRAPWVLGLAGCCLILLQAFMIREVTALLRGTELVILLVTVAYFAGYSIGYGAARWLTADRIRVLALVTWALHITLPFSFRYLGGAFMRLGAGLGFFALLFLTAFALSSFYSVLLPRFIDQASEGPRSIARLYGTELVGAIAGILVLLVTASRPWLTALVYQAALAATVGLLWWRAALWPAAVAAVVCYGMLYGPVDRHSLEFSYASIQGLHDPRALYSVSSFYQRVDILSAGGRKYIYLGGRMNYGSDSLSSFNICLSDVPARLIRPKEALIVGSGSMASVKYVAASGAHVTTVEIDEAVIEGSRRHLGDVNRLGSIDRWTLVISDAKQYLGSVDRKFDLIVMDVPAPTTIQVALLHTVEFYTLARARLTERGVLSVSLSGEFAPGHETPCTVAAALLRVFPSVIVFTDLETERSFALAGDALSFDEEGLRRAAAESSGSPRVEIFGRDAVESVVADTPPLTADTMAFVVKRSWARLKDTFLSGDRE